jgi:oligopeptidase B
VEAQVDHHGDAAGQGQFLIVTNDHARDFKLMTVPAASPDREHWRELVPHRPGVLLEHVHAFRHYIVRAEREGGLPRIRMTLPDGSSERDVPFPEPVYSVTLGANENYDAASVRLHYSSLVTPNTAVDFDMAAGRWAVVKRDDIPHGYDPSQYECERLMAVAPDGARVPISLVRRKGAARDGTGGLLLIGYGSYGASYDPAFDAKRLSLLDRGVAVAIAHVRGGSEMGRAWYEDGKLLRKTNTFTDFIACAEHLVSLGHTSPARLAINGVSAGGLLMGAVTNLRPELFGAVVADVPFVDVINTMNDPSIPLTVIEYEEWGNPGNRAHFGYMLQYSPYDNVAPKAYPHLLVTAGLNDPRVQYWEPAKWVAKLRAMKTDDNVLLLRTNMGAGHGGASGRYDHLKEWAFRYAFILDRLGLAAETPYGHGGIFECRG